jgi:hypothetical protein
MDSTTLSEVPHDIVHLSSLLHRSLHGDTNLSNGVGHLELSEIVGL